MREYVQQKMDKAQKYFDHIVWGQAFLFVEKRAHKAEMIVHAPGQTFRALATAADLYSAIDLASDKIDAQLKKHKERVKTRHKAKTSETMSETSLPASAFSVVRQTVAPTTPGSAPIEEHGDERARAFSPISTGTRIRSTSSSAAATRRFGIVQPVRKNKR